MVSGGRQAWKRAVWPKMRDCLRELEGRDGPESVVSVESEGECVEGIMGVMGERYVGSGVVSEV